MSPRLPRLPELRAVDDLEAEIAQAAQARVDQYIPVKHRTKAPDIKELGGLTVTAVKNFAELPTKQIDDLIAAVKEKIASIEQRANAIKEDYSNRVADLTSSIERLNEACIKSESKMDELHNQLTELYRAPRGPEGDAA